MGRVRLGPGVEVAADALRFEFVSSSGPGGQNVNRRSTKARLRLSLDAFTMPPGAKSRLKRLAGSMLTDEGELIIAADETRSQARNKQAALDRLRALIAEALVKPKPRKKTRPSRGAVERRLQAKRERSETKARRRPPRGRSDD